MGSLKIGVASVTFRNKTVGQVVEIAKNAGVCINLLRNPRWGIAQKTYGEAPFLLGKMGVALTKAMQENGIIACPKHYALNSIGICVSALMQRLMKELFTRFICLTSKSVSMPVQCLLWVHITRLTVLTLVKTKRF